MTCFKLKTGETLFHYCKRNGISYWTMQARCDKFGLTPDEALVASPRVYTYYWMLDGKPLKTLCRETGVPYTTVLSRAKRLKCSVKEAYEHFLKRSESNDRRTNKVCGTNRGASKDDCRDVKKSRRERCPTLRISLPNC